MQINMKPNIKKGGYSLVEMIVYVALLSLILLSIINIVFSFGRSYERLGALRTAEHTGLAAMERIVRDIHAATSVDTSLSTLGTSPGVLSLVAGATTTKFYVVNGELRMDVMGSYVGPLSVSSAKLTSLTFKLITTPKTQAVKIDMTVMGTAGQATSSKTFHTTAILKNS